MKNAIVQFRFYISAITTLLILIVDDFFFKGQLVSSRINGATKETYGAIATVLGALLGFQITAFAIIASFLDSTAMKRLRKNRTDARIFDQFSISTIVLGTSTICSIFAIFTDTSHHHSGWIEYAVLFFSIYSSLSIASSVLLINAIINAVSKTD